MGDFRKHIVWNASQKLAAEADPVLCRADEVSRMLSGILQKRGS